MNAPGRAIINSVCTLAACGYGCSEIAVRLKLHSFSVSKIVYDNRTRIERRRWRVQAEIQKFAWRSAR